VGKAMKQMYRCNNKRRQEKQDRKNIDTHSVFFLFKFVSYSILSKGFIHSDTSLYMYCYLTAPLLPILSLLYTL
jgi:hypothetical protein